MSSNRETVDNYGNPLRLLMVHAHPDDETTTTGATVRHYAADGVDVHLVTCTRGERGDIVDEEVLASLSDTGPNTDPDVAAERLGEHRAGELAAACRELGFADWRFLAEPGRWWDSGMAGEPTGRHPRAFSAGDIDGQAGQLVEVIRELRPQVVVTYDERGGYHHPDHIRAHEVTMAAARRASDHALPVAGEPWAVSKVYACVVPHSALRRAGAMLAQTAPDAPNPFTAEPLPFGVPDELINARIDASRWLPAKVAAMRSHRSQMATNGWFFTIAENGGFGVEHYQLLTGTSAPAAPGALENDLFAGIRAS